jgi:SPP1 gp7 family putative phage head morphogenesis protein
VRRHVFPRVERFVPDELRTDATDDSLSDSVRRQVLGSLDTRQVGSRAESLFERVLRHSRSEFDRLDIALSLEDEPDLARMIKRWRRDLVDWTKAVEENELDRLERILTENRGLRVEELTHKLEERLEVTLEKARSLARNQVVQLHAAVSEERMKAAAITEYVWTTAGNEKVSDAHRSLNGRRFRFDDPPTDADGNTGNPGTIRPNCQCTAYPVIPELDDE